MDFINFDKYFIVNKNFLSSYFRNFSSFYEDSLFLSGFGDSIELFFSFMYGDVEDLFFDFDSFSEVLRAFIRDNWLFFRFYGFFYKEDIMELEEE